MGYGNIKYGLRKILITSYHDIPDNRLSLLGMWFGGPVTDSDLFHLFCVHDSEVRLLSTCRCNLPTGISRISLFMNSIR